MTYCRDEHSILTGDPEQIRGQVSELSRCARNMDDVARRLRGVQVDGVWSSAAGNTFAARIGTTPTGLEDIADKLHDAARIMRPYATKLESSLRDMKKYDKDAASADRVMKARDATLESMTPDDPERARVQRERGEAAADLTSAERGFAREGEAAFNDEQRMAGQLSHIRPDLEDSAGYDWLEFIEGAGRTASSVGILAKPIALGGVGDPIGKAGRRIFYDEGSWKGVAKSGMGYGMDVGTLGVSKVARAVRKKWGDLPTNTPDPTRVGGLPSKPKRIKDNPIAAPAATTRRAQRQLDGIDPHGRIVQKAKSKSGMTDLEDAMDDWSDYTGANNIAKVTIVVEHSTKTANRVGGIARTTPKAIKSAGIDRHENARKERAEQRRQATVERARNGPLPGVG